MVITTEEALTEYPKLKEWSEKARKVLGDHCFTFVDEGDWVEEVNNEDVLLLIKEYDALFKGE